ncbi:MAG: conserved phage C-terminal domain-containing protein [Candidatus Brocadiaceae bacterium]|nr:conserved phage C-terminal domain-containing protein [Candidatus Brocadiaceae bacterium]
MSKLLIDDYPLMILPNLAVKIGLNEAVVLQQLHYWLERSNNRRDGRTWVYNSYREWHEQFPFWSVDTVKRTINKLEKQGYVVSSDSFNTYKMDKTKWYTIDYEMLSALVPIEPETGANCTNLDSRKHQAIPETNITETTNTENTKKEKEKEKNSEAHLLTELDLPASSEAGPHPSFVFSQSSSNAKPQKKKRTKTTYTGNEAKQYESEAREILEYCNKQWGTKYEAKQTSLMHIIPRLREGHSVDDFKAVIDKRQSSGLTTIKCAAICGQPRCSATTTLQSTLKNKR